MFSTVDELHGFAIAGEDRKWSWADARIDGKTILVSSAQVPHRVAVRYACYQAVIVSAEVPEPVAHNPPVTLYDQGGYSAAPFRSDG